jgi:hypothetical protein
MAQTWHSMGGVLRRRGHADVAPTQPVGPAAWPNASTTGPRIALTNSGITVLRAGDVVSGLNFTNYVSIQGNAQITDCKFSGGVIFSALANGAAVNYCSVLLGLSVSSSQNISISNCDISGAGDIIHVAADSPVGTRPTNIYFQNVYAHDPNPPAGAHSDGIQITGCRYLTLDNCYIDMGPWVQVGGVDVLNAAFFTQPSQGLIGGIHVYGGYFNGGGLVFRYEGTYTDDFVVQDVVIGSDGHFGYQYTPAVGTGPSLQSGNQTRAGDGTLSPITFLST